MPLEKVWVFGESYEGKPLGFTLELLTKARELASNVACFYVGPDAEAVAPELGRYGAGTVYTLDTGDLLPGAPAAAAMAEVAGRENPDLILFSTSYTGRDVCGRLSVRLDTPVI